MTSYTDRFGDATIQVGYPSYTSITLTANVQLAWANQFQNTLDVVSHIIDVDPNAGGHTLTLPTALDVSVGQDFVINNVSAFSFTLNTNAAGVSFPIAAGKSFYFYLIDNSTADGIWRQTPFTAGGVVVTSVSAVTANDNLSITGSPIISAGTFTFNFTRDLLAVTGLNNTAGLLYRAGTHNAPVWGAVTITGSANINVANGGGPANPVITLASNVTGLTSLQVGTLTFNGSTITNTAPQLTLNGGSFNINNNAGIKLFNTLNAFSTLIQPGAIVADNTIILPIAAPIAGQFLKANTVVGPIVNTSWATGNSGTLTSLIAGTGLSGGTITTTGTIAVNINLFAQGRLTLTSNVPVTINDVVAAATIYYTPYVGNYISLFTAAAWKSYAFTQVSIAVPAAAAQMYDIFLYDNAGTLMLFTVAWANDTTRAVALAYQDGVLCLSGDLAKRYLGSFRTLGLGQTEDSRANRLVSNNNNRVQKLLFKNYNAGNWSFAFNGVFRQMNASVTNQFGVVSNGEDIIRASMQIVSNNNAATGVYMIGFGESSTTIVSGNSSHANNFHSSLFIQETCTYTNALPSGYYFLTALEQLATAGTVSVYNQTTGLTFVTSGMNMQGIIHV